MVLWIIAIALLVIALSCVASLGYTLWAWKFYKNDLIRTFGDEEA